MPSVRTHLWFGNNAAVEAANFYAEHVPNSAVTKVFTARTNPATRSPRSWSSRSPDTRWSGSMRGQSFT